MGDKLVTNNGETVEIDSIIEALESAPDKSEIVGALRELRKDKVKTALGETVKAAQFNREKALGEFLADGEKSENTQKTYRIEIARYFSWLDRTNIHLLQARRADANKFKSYLSERYSQNTVRLTIAACSSFHAYLEAERFIDHSPFASIKYPKKQYRKAVSPDQGKPVPVMNDEEYQVIINTLVKKAKTKGKRICDERSRESAKRLLPIVHFMGTYGLRIGDVLTVRLEVNDRFSFRQKGNTVRQKELLPASRQLLRRYGANRREPFKGIPAITIQGALRRLTVALAESGVIRHPYSSHDFRHFYAVNLYRETRDIYAVKEALGHASVNVTEIYLAGLGLLA
jgi:site-specific recombinase XerD